MVIWLISQIMTIHTIVITRPRIKQAIAKADDTLPDMSLQVNMVSITLILFRLGKPLMAVFAFLEMAISKYASWGSSVDRVDYVSLSHDSQAQLHISNQLTHKTTHYLHMYVLGVGASMEFPDQAYLRKSFVNIAQRYVWSPYPI